MKRHLFYLPEYLWRCFHRVDFICGGVIAIAYFAVTTMLLPSFNGWTAVIFLGSFIWAGWAVFHEERVMRAEHEKGVRVTAKVGRYSENYPVAPEPGKERIGVGVIWEVWVDHDVSTDKLALNILHIYRKKWWEFWRKSRIPVKGVPIKGQDSQQYRKRIQSNVAQPFRDEGEFEYIGDMPDKPYRLEFELVLVTGMPSGVHRVPVFIDWSEIHARGSSPPL